MKSIILLHGALGDKSQFKELEKLLKSDYHVYSFNFNGHGKSKRENRKFSVPNLAEDVIAWMNLHHIEQAQVFGYSMGGYVGLWLARHHSERVGSIITLGTKLKWDDDEVIKEVKMLDAEKIEIKVPSFANLLKKRHGELAWKTVLVDTIDLMKDLGVNSMSAKDFEFIQHDVLLCRGEQDVMVSLEETSCVSDLLVNGELKELQDCGHSFDEINPLRLRNLIKSFVIAEE